METDRWGRRIRAFRKLKGFTQEGLAKHIGVSVSVMGEIERGSREPTEAMLGKIAAALQVTVRELAPSEDKE